MKSEVLLVQQNCRVVAICARVLELRDGVVHALHVGGMVLAVVNLIDLPRDMRLERAVAVVQVG
jgi:hypothetical protein